MHPPAPETGVLTDCKTLQEMFWQRVATDPDRHALYVKDDAEFHPLTWTDIANDVVHLARRLLALGCQRGDRIAQWSENCYEWIVADLAILTIGAAHVPIHAPLSASQALFQIGHSGAKLVLVQGAEQCKKLEAALRQATEPMPAVLWLCHQPADLVIGNTPVVSWRIPQSQPVDRRGMDELVANADPTDIATILYTSGTTGDPKGVVLTHHNLVSNVVATVTAFDERATDVRVCFLPLSHVFARTCDLYAWIARGSILAMAASRESLMDDLRLIQPTLLNGVPYFFERVYRRLVEAGTVNHAGVLRELLGGKIRGCCSGGAALPVYLYDYFESQGVPVLQGYGLTESSPVITVSTEFARKRGCVGKPIRGVEVRIDEDGEILTRGPHVMREYWNNARATSEVLREGWLHTGDLGEWTSDGFLKITGRKKEIIVLSSGKNVVPGVIESMLCREPLIEQAVVVGDDRSYLVALIVPHAESLKREIRSQRLWVWSKRRAVTHPKILALYRQRIEAALATLSHHEQVRQFAILDRGFTIESGHLTPKASLKRDAILRDFAAHIDQLYRK
jgi:long-chain acyl-CoA synthetase